MDTTPPASFLSARKHVVFEQRVTDDKEQKRLTSPYLSKMQESL